MWLRTATQIEMEDEDVFARVCSTWREAGTTLDAFSERAIEIR